MTGLRGFVLTSATGARSRLTPTPASSAPIEAATRSVSSTSSAAPSARFPGYELPDPASSRVTSPPSSSIPTSTSARSARMPSVSRASWARSRTLREKRTTPPSPSATSRRSQSGAETPRAPGKMQAEASRSSSLIRSRSSLDRPGRQPEGDLPLHEQEEDHHRDRGQRRAGHQPAPVRVAARARVVREPDGQRLLRLIREQDVGEDELVPRRDEREHRGGHEARGDERQQDPDERPQPAGAVHHRRLLELAWNAEEEAAERPDAEREHEGHVGDDHAGERIRL